MDKLEKHIKSKLQNREISPSPDAWSKISGALDSERETSPRRTYWWAIAASLIGLVVVSVGLFNTQSAIRTRKDTVVSSEENKKTESTEIQGEESFEKTSEKNSEKEFVLEIPLNQKQVQEEKAIENIVEVAQMEADDKEHIKDVKEITDLAITNKLEEVLAQVNAMEGNAITVSDAEIDALLMTAQRELLTKKAFQESGKVDAMALLNEVELELYDDEQNPLFIKLKEGFFKLRTAVVDRNN